MDTIDSTPDGSKTNIDKSMLILDSHYNNITSLYQIEDGNKDGCDSDVLYLEQNHKKEDFLLINTRNDATWLSDKKYSNELEDWINNKNQDFSLNDTIKIKHKSMPLPNTDTRDDNSNSSDDDEPPTPTNSSLNLPSLTYFESYSITSDNYTSPSKNAVITRDNFLESNSISNNNHNILTLNSKPSDLLKFDMDSIKTQTDDSQPPSSLIKNINKSNSSLSPAPSVRFQPEPVHPKLNNVKRNWLLNLFNDMTKPGLKQKRSFSSLFSKKSKDTRLSRRLSSIPDFSKLSSSKHIIKNLLLPQKKSPKEGDPHDSYNRYPLHIERSIYRLSQKKLANPRRPLQQQTVIANLITHCVSIHNNQNVLDTEKSHEFTHHNHTQDLKNQYSYLNMMCQPAYPSIHPPKENHSIDEPHPLPIVDKSTIQENTIISNSKIDPSSQAAARQLKKTKYKPIKNTEYNPSVVYGNRFDI